jgi:2-polyprenyl-3-methyl-5-hydroxy-6-metoxy-1,4-benzoquinol methylase
MEESKIVSKSKKLGILLPLYGALAPSFFINFLNRLHELYTNNRNYSVKIYMKVSTIIDVARNELVRDALADGCDYLLFWDSDIIIPRGGIDKLVDMNEDIASGLYFAKGKPYLPVARLMRDDGVGGEQHFFLEEFEYGKIMDVAGVGLGLCLIKADVFKKLTYPFFKLEWRQDPQAGWYQIAEDLYFCDMAREAGYKIKLNTGLLLEHEGIPVSAAHFNIYKEQLALDKKNREELIEDLAEFEKVTKGEIEKRFNNRNRLRNAEFNKMVPDPTDQKALDNYYVNNNYEIYDHFQWHLQGRRPFDKKLLEDIKTLNPSRATEIVDYGCGGGQMAYMLAQEKYVVTIIEKNKKELDFISYRFKKHKLKVKIVPMPIHERFENKFDIVLCFDVLEHVPDKEFESTINRIKSLKKSDGKVFATVSFGAQEAHPSHFEMTEKKKKLIMDLVN